jgi:hypothetical protein
MESPTVVLLYGFVHNGEKVIDGSELFKLSYYGTTDGSDVAYVGIEFGTIYKLFKDTHHDDKELVLTTLKPTDEIMIKMQKLYPDKDLHCRAIIQNVYTSHYIYGNIWCGYWYEPLQNSDTYDDFDNMFRNHIKEDFKYDHNKTATVKYEYTTVAHTFHNDKHMFVGKILREFECFENFNCADEALENEPGYCFYKMLTEKYKITDQTFELTFDYNVMVSKKVIAFVPMHCDCCT